MRECDSSSTMLQRPNQNLGLLTPILHGHFAYTYLTLFDKTGCHQTALPRDNQMCTHIHTFGQMGNYSKYLFQD